ncbi:MAG: DUF507 family protein [Bdellovibrionota bacterium]
MRLREEEVIRVVERLVRVWQEQKLVQTSHSSQALKTKLQSIFIQDLQVEDLLNQEVEKMLEKFAPQIDRGEIDKHKMFQMIKNQLIKERKLVI